MTKIVQFQYDSDHSVIYWLDENGTLWRRRLAQYLEKFNPSKGHWDTVQPKK